MKRRRGIRERVAAALIVRLGPVIVSLLGASLRITRSGLENLAAAREEAGNVIFVFWHARMLLPGYLHRHQGAHVLSSTHRDGVIAARTVQRMGYVTVWGSSTRGGAGALIGLIQVARDGHDVAISIDGPRGPRERVQPGAIFVAKRTGLPVVPVAASFKPAVRLRSWDRFMIPLPLARSIMVYGEPVTYDEDTSEEAIEEARQDLERRITEVTREADVGCGRTN